MPLNPGDSQLFQAWLDAIEGLTNAQVAERMVDLSEEGVRQLRGKVPSRLNARTKLGMRRLLEGKSGGERRIAAAEGAGRTPSGLAEPARVWVAKFLLKLTEAGCLEDEVDEARILLTRSDLVTYAHGGRGSQVALSPEQQLQLVKTIAGAAIIPRLKEMGRRVNASWAR